MDVVLFLFFIVIPFFRLFGGSLLANLHNIIAVAAIGGIIFGILFNKLNEYIDWLLKYMIPVLLSTIAVHFFLQTYDSAQIKITLLELGGPLVLILWLIKRINMRNFKINSYRKSILIPALCVLFYGIISFALSQFKLETFEDGLLRRIAYLGVFIVVIFEFNHKEDFKRILNWVLASCFLVVVYGFIQRFGLDWHIWAGAFGASVFSTFGNPNFYAAWLVLVLPLILSKIMLTKKWYYIVFAVAIVLNLFWTGTKGSWVGLGVELSVFIVLATLYLVKGNPQMLKRTAKLMLVGIFIVVVSGVTWFSIKRITSIRFRLFTWGAAMNMISEPIFVNPVKAVILGHGIETFSLVYPAYRRPEIFHIEGKHNTQTDHAHNEFLEIFYDEGLIGLTIFLWFLISIYKGAFNRLKMAKKDGAISSNEFYLVGLMAGTLGMLAHAGVSVHVRFVSSGYILWTFLGLMAVLTSPSKKESLKQEKLNTGWGLLLIIALIAVAVWSSVTSSRRFLANIYHNRAIAFSKQRQWDRALHYYDRVQEYHPSFVMAHYFEGNVYNDILAEALRNNDSERVQRYYEKARDTYIRVKSMFPNYVQIHFQMGMLHLKVGQIEEAKKSFRRYMNIVDPVFPVAYFRKGAIYARENPEMAQWFLEEAVRRKPLMLDTHLNLANIHKAKNNFKAAADTYRTALTIDENNLSVLNTLGRLYEILGENEKALEIYKRLIKQQPENEEIIKRIENLKS